MCTARSPSSHCFKHPLVTGGKAACSSFAHCSFEIPASQAAKQLAAAPTCHSLHHACLNFLIPPPLPLHQPACIHPTRSCTPCLGICSRSGGCLGQHLHFRSHFRKEWAARRGPMRSCRCRLGQARQEGGPLKGVGRQRGRGGQRSSAGHQGAQDACACRCSSKRHHFLQSESMPLCITGR